MDQKERLIKKWYFDDYPRKKDGPRSWVQLADEKDVDGQALEVFVNGVRKLSFSGEIDQWGTWIEISAPDEFTVAQEWSTKSFVQALIAGLTEFSKICDLEGKPEKQMPEYVEEPYPVEEPKVDA